MSQLTDSIKKCDALIRAGDFDAVQKMLTGMKTTSLSRLNRLELAGLCRRAGLSNLGLRILAPIVNSSRENWQENASPAEMAEYAINLQCSGALREARWTLSHVDAKKAPEANLYLAMCLFSSWDYAEAIEALETFINEDVTPYQRLVGRVNLAAALVAVRRFDQAFAVISESIDAANNESSTRLHANCLELRAQANIYLRNFREARADLSEASRLLSASGSLDLFFVRKWIAIMDALESEKTGPLLDFRQEALKRRHWESVREADRFALEVKFAQSTFDGLIFGTPHRSYRDSLLSCFSSIALPETLLLGGPTGPIFDIQTGEISGATNGKFEKPPLKVHRLLEILLRDFYRPAVNGGIFSELFPGEYFDPLTSVHRVHQAIYRARKWLDKNGVPIEIVEDCGAYSIKLNSSFGILVPYERRPIEIESVRIESLRRRFGEQEFTTREACSLLDISASSFKELCSHAIENRTLQRIGATTSARYRFISEAIVDSKAA